MLATMIFLASMFDFMDGLTARNLNAYSEVGKQLDSLADMVTFGVVPGMILFNMLVNRDISEESNSSFLFGIFKYFPFILTVFTAIRLAKFNTDQRQANAFYGLPSPAMGILVTSFPLIIRYDSWHLAPFLSSPLFIFSISIILSVLMVSRIKLFALKFKTMKWEENKIQFIFLIISVLLFAIFLFTAIPMIITLYIVLSIINNTYLNRVSL
jgi:CDP-diacylglycerol--serine O-phosphatidyltransferase